ncbi:endochitinase [Ixodes scapularis]
MGVKPFLFTINMSTILPFLSFILCIISSTQSADDFIKNGGTPVVCYYHGWAATRSSPMNYRIKDIPGDLCTHVNLNYAGIDMDKLTVKDLIPAYQINSRQYKEFTGIKSKFLFVKTMISLGGWDQGGEAFSYVARDPVRRCNFTKNLYKFLKDNDFDGVDIDWRFPASPDRAGQPEDKENYVQLLKSFCSLRKKGLTVTATVPITPYYLDAGYDIKEMAKYVDWFNVLGFDLRGRWTGIADVHSPLHARSFETGDVRNLNVPKQHRFVKSLANGWQWSSGKWPDSGQTVASHWPMTGLSLAIDHWPLAISYRPSIG